MSYAHATKKPFAHELRAIRRAISLSGALSVPRRTGDLFAFGLATLALLLNAISLRFVGDALYLLDLVAVLAAALVGGPRAGCIALAIVSPGLALLPLAPGVTWPWNALHVTRLALFTCTAGVFSSVVCRMRTALIRSRVLSRQLARAGSRDRRALLDLERERAVRDRLVAMLSHDLRNPIAAVKMHLQLMRRAGTLAPDQDARALHAIRGLERANKLIEDLLDANRIEAGQMPPMRFENGDLREIVREATEDFGADVVERLELDLAPAEGVYCADAVRRVLENLVTNAVKYGDRERMIRMRVRTTATHAHLVVQNFGVPLTAEEQKQMFEPFRRTAGAEASAVRGWGIGLTLVSGLVQAHGGRISVRSSFADGTEFEVRLPRYR